MGKSEFVGASAGSGKTFRLTQRTYDSIGTENGLVIAVTFTRAATAEMRKRILDRVDSSELDYADKLRQITRAGGVQFSTFDSFFYQILAAHGAPVDIADEKETAIIRERIARVFFDEIVRAEKVDEIVISCRLLGTSIEKLTRDLAEGRRGRFEKNDISEERFSKIVGETARLKGEIRGLQDDLGKLDPDEVSPAVKRSVLCLSGAEITKLTESKAFSYADLCGWKALGKSLAWSKAPYSEINRIFMELRGKLTAYLRNRAILRELTLTEMHKVYGATARRVKLKERKIFFEDILDRLIALDGKEAEQRAEVMGLYFELGLDRVRHLLIDEFQDTSRDNMELILPLMEEILSGVGENGEGERSVFIVGDWKQMIYGWRGADREAIEKGLSRYLGGQLQEDYLPYNWRSTPLLIDFFNRTVSEIYPGSGAKDRQLQPPRKEFEGISEVNLIQVEVERNQKTLFYERMIDTIKANKAEWGCDYSDITLIFRTNAEKESMAQKLAEAGIGFAEVKGRQILASEEGVAVFSLLAFLFAGEGSAFLEKALEASCYRAGLMEIARRKERIVSRYASPYGLQAVGDVLEMCRGIVADPIIEAFEEEAESLFRTGGDSAEGFLAYIFKVRDKVSVAEPAHSERVKLATIHGAKGLEFPHVFLLWMEQNRPYPFHVPEFQCHMSFTKNETAFLESVDRPDAARILSALNKEREKVETEKANLLYVAMTRATQSVSIFVRKKKNEDNCHGESGRELTRKILSVMERGGFDAECRRDGDDISWRKDYGPRRQKESREVLEIGPFRLCEAEEGPSEVVELDRSLVAEDVRVGIERGKRIHRFLANLGDSCAIPAGHGLPPAELSAVSAFLADPKVADILFRPGKLYAEQAISNKQCYGVVDKMIVEDDRITLLEFKTGAPGENLDSYLDQARRYGEIMKSLYPGRSIEAYLLFVDGKQKVRRVEPK